MKTKAKTTLHDVAAAAGVSIATASKALNDVPVSAANKQKVLKAAAHLGYVANETARALKRKRSHTIGLIFSETVATRQLGLLDAMSGALESAGYSLICATARADANVYDVLMRRFLERRVDGLFCVTPPERLASARDYRSAGIPIVVVTERSQAVRDQPLVRPSIEEAVRTSLTEMVGLGHHRILALDDGAGNLGLTKIDPRVRRRIDVDLIALSDAGSLDQLVQHQVLRPDSRPTLISATLPYAEGVLAACRAVGITIGVDLSVMALTNSTNEQRAEQLDLSSLFIQPELLGIAAAKQMLQLIDSKQVPKELTVEVGTWNPRGSVGRYPGSTKR